ncbi:MAG: hypothetical protein ACOZIN_22490 [Myxococcota bacterium]
MQLSLPLGSPRRHERRLPGFAAALAIVIRAGRQSEYRRRATATCPRCGRHGHLDTEFGTRRLQGKERPQSWCRACRSRPSASPKRQEVMPLH